MSILCKVCGLGLAVLAIVSVFAVLHRKWWHQPTAVKSIQKDWMDTTAEPGVDFNRFANGKWIDNTNIPPDQSRWGNFNVLRDNTLDVLRQILEQQAQATGLKPGSVEQQVGDFYASAMDEAAIEAAGITPLMPAIGRINAISNPDELAREVARLHSMGVNVLFGFGSGSDFKNSEQTIALAAQGGLGLPGREYYLKTDTKSGELREKYAALVEQTFVNMGVPAVEAKANAAAVLAIETALAESCMTKVEQRSPENIYHITSLDDFAATVPNLPVKVYLQEIGAPSFTTLNVMQPAFFTGLNTTLATTSVDDVKVYLKWQLAHAMSPYLPAKFSTANFEFYGKTLQGAKAQQPRWKRMVEATNGSLGEALAQLYVAKAFSPEAKAKALKLVEDVREALRETLMNVTWMSDATRKNALAKLNSFEAKIGYPDKFIDYSSVTIDRTSLAGNVLRTNEFASRRDMAKIGKKVDRSEWHMLPQMVNAYYSPEVNQIVFPAAILQAPFFDPTADDAVNYGGIGVVIGHEMTHGFDDEGSKFDAQGNVAYWWTEADRANFDARMNLIRSQFSQFQVGNLHVNGELVCGEAAADLGGVKLAYQALQRSLKGKARRKDANGFTEEQRFFIAFGQVWASKVRPEAEAYLVENDPHPLARFRVNGTLAHLPEFAKAFGLPDNAPIMLPLDKRCQLW